MMDSQRLHSVVRGVAPCKDCTEKFEACHGVCPIFKKWTAEKERVQKERKKYIDYISMRKYW